MTHDPELADFLKTHPEYSATAALDSLRQTEYTRLDAAHRSISITRAQACMPKSQILRHHQMLSEHVFGNPHSSNPSSLASTELVERTRAYILQFFHADPAEYTAIFTANASGALKIVGESYPFDPDSRYLLTFDNHNSVNGIREFAHARGAQVTYIPVALPDMRVDEAQLDLELSRPSKNGHNLFAFPAQSNFSGVQHPLEWIEKAQAHGWDVLLDAAAFVPTNPLDLSSVQPDFVPVSFYKMFGYPTGIGALIARREALAQTAPSLVRGRDDHGRLRAGRQVLPGGWTGGIRGRHARLPQHPRRGDRAQAPRTRSATRRSTSAWLH